MSLAELIEFFCNQRKTGRLKIDYPRGHSVFFIKDGELVDAKVGALSGPEAVYFSLTLPNAAFDFSPDVQATRRTIHNAWTQVVLEGLRRLDEGLSPTGADAFGAWSPGETELAQMLDRMDNLDTPAQPKSAREKERAARAVAPKDEESSVKESPVKDSSPEPFSLMVESANGASGSKKKFVLAGVAAAVVLACAVAAVPLLNRTPAKTEADTAATAPAPAAPAEVSPAEAAPAEASGDEAAATPDADAAADAAADTARREERERKERERRRREEAAKKEEAANALNPTDPAAAAPKPVTATGPKSVRVTVNYDEAGRVTAASVAGSTPGAEAYGSTAVRIARGKRFPAGKPGSTVVTIPVN
jgi:TonB family protein